MEAALVSRDIVGVQDFVLLEDFGNIDAFIENLRKRFRENLIYVSKNTSSSDIRMECTDRLQPQCLAGGMCSNCVKPNVAFETILTWFIGSDDAVRMARFVGILRRACIRPVAVLMRLTSDTTWIGLALSAGCARAYTYTHAHTHTRAGTRMRQTSLLCIHVIDLCNALSPVLWVISARYTPELSSIQ